VLDNALNLKAANELKFKKAQDADNRNARAFGPGARDVKKPQKEKEKRKQQNDVDSIARPPVQQAQSPPQPPPRQPSPPPSTLYSAPPTYQSSQGAYLDHYGKRNQFGVKEINGKRKPLHSDNDDISTMTPSVSSNAPKPLGLPFLPGKRQS